MPLMKAQHTQRVRESAIVMDLADLEHEAGQILAKARLQAQQIVSGAIKEAEATKVRIIEEARTAGQAEGFAKGNEEGFKQGHDEALAAVGQQLKELSARWSQTLDLLHQHMPVHVADAKTDLVKLALTIAERVTRQEGMRNRQVAPALVEDALRMIGSARMVALHVSPIEMDLLENYLPDLLATLRGIESVQLTPDDSVGPGGCVLRFGAGQIDATLEAQLGRIAEELIGPEEVAARAAEEIPLASAPPADGGAT